MSDNNDNKVVWERWTKTRTFVRALEGTYGELKEDLYTQPRVYSSQALPWRGGPQNFGKGPIDPGKTKVTQAIETHVDCFAPGGHGQKHGHMNSAVFFCLKGKGHDVHDGRRIDWASGDALIVENGCVHQHFSDDREKETVVLIMKAKPTFLFHHLMFQTMVEWPPKQPVPGQEDFVPPESI